MPPRTPFLRTLMASTASLMLLAAPWSAPSALAQEGPPPDRQPAGLQPAARAARARPAADHHRWPAGARLHRDRAGRSGGSLCADLRPLCGLRPLGLSGLPAVLLVPAGLRLGRADRLRRPV